MSQLFRNVPTVDSRLSVVLGTSNPEYVQNSLPFDGGQLAVDVTGSVSYVNSGVPFTSRGRIAAVNGVPDQKSAGGLPLNSGRVCLQALAPDRVQSGIPYTVSDSLATTTLTPPEIEVTTQPESVVTSKNVSASVTTVVSNTGGTLSYQWEEEVNGLWVPVTNTGSVSGATSDTLTFTSPQVADSVSRLRCKVSNGSFTVVTQAVSVTIVPWFSFHTLPGAANWWDECSEYQGYYTNPDPDQGPIIQPNNSGARAGVAEDTGWTDVEVITWWSGITGAQAAPLVCINEDDPMFGMGFWWETEILFDPIVHWEIGRQPSDIDFDFVDAPPAPYVPGVPVELKMRVENNVISTYMNGVFIRSYPVPAGLQGSTTHGMSLDVNAYPGRPPDLKCAVVPYTIRNLG